MRYVFSLVLVLILSSVSYSQVRSERNIFGGYNYYSNGQTWKSQSNIFGGHNYRSSRGKSFSTRSNIFGGYNYYGNPYYMRKKNE